MTTTTTKKNGAGLSRKAINLLRKVEKYILEEPKRLEMGLWGHHVNSRDLELYKESYPNTPPCGTMACIAGTVKLLGVKNVPKDGSGEWPYFFDNSQAFAKQILGLTEEQQAKLFFVREEYSDIGWPEPFKSRYTAAKDRGHHKTAAKIAVARIEHFIKTGE